MKEDTINDDLPRRVLCVLVTGLALVIVCYFWVDRPVAFYVHDHQIEKFTLWKVNLFKLLTEPPPVVQTWLPLTMVILVIQRTRRPWALWQRTFFAASLSLIVSNEFRTLLGDLSGRYWPETWFHDNPSLIGNGSYGFHPFQGGDDIGSFPSGHSARIAGFATVWWMSIPGSRHVWILICPPMLASLVAMNYHFVSDVIAGTTLGIVIGLHAASIAGTQVNHTSAKAA